MLKAHIGRPQEIIELRIAHAKLNPGGFIGPWLMGIVGYTLLMGILSVQAARYFSTYGFESRGLFSLVVVSLTLATGLWGVAISAGWDWFVMNYGDWGLLVSVPWQVWMTTILTTLTVFTSQLFFAHRCYTFYGRSKIIFGSLLLGMVASTVMFILIGSIVAIDPFNFELGKKFGVPASVISLVTDFAITGLTVYKLTRHRGATGNPNTDDALIRLRNITLEAAAPPAVFSLLNMISFLSMWTQNVVFLFFGLLTPSLYVFSLLFALNSRIDVRRKLASPNDDAETLSTRLEFSPASRNKTYDTADTRSTGQIFSTATVPNFAPNAPRLELPAEEQQHLSKYVV